VLAPTSRATLPAPSVLSSASGALMSQLAADVGAVALVHVAAAPAVATVATVASLPGSVAAEPAAPPTELTEPDDAGTSAAARARRMPSSTTLADGDIGPRRLTLRELAPDLVQATLRDTQLDLAASRLAAQGLARALMEAGYAQARVVVNGQTGRAAAADGDLDHATPSAPVHPFTANVSKDPIHGN